MLRITLMAGLLLATMIGEGTAGPVLADRSMAVAADGGLLQPVKSRQHRTAVAPRPVMGTTGPVTGMGGVPPPPLPPALGKPPGGAPESFGDRAVRCIHHGGSFGVPQSQMGVYTHNCAFGN